MTLSTLVCLGLAWFDFFMFTWINNSPEERFMLVDLVRVLMKRS